MAHLRCGEEMSKAKQLNAIQTLRLDIERAKSEQRKLLFEEWVNLAEEFVKCLNKFIQENPSLPDEKKGDREQVQGMVDSLLGQVKTIKNQQQLHKREREGDGDTRSAKAAKTHQGQDAASAASRAASRLETPRGKPVGFSKGHGRAA